MVQDIIPEYPEHERAELRAAADSWRLPYWDWARNPKIPSLAAARRFRIKIWDGNRVVIENPLYQFKMPNDKNMDSEGVYNVKVPDGDSVLRVCPQQEIS
jgi:hypothetical protein